jgi:anti-anti-sigma regulatory factor
MVVRMTMTTIPVWHEIDGERVADTLQETCQRLNGDAGDIFLDFSSVRRVDPVALKAMGELARLADAKSARVALRAVNVDVYRVLKLMRLASRFSFVA